MSFRDVVIFLLFLTAVMVAVRSGGGAFFSRQHGSVVSDVDSISQDDPFTPE